MACGSSAGMGMVHDRNGDRTRVGRMVSRCFASAGRGCVGREPRVCEHNHGDIIAIVALLHLPHVRGLLDNLVAYLLHVLRLVVVEHFGDSLRAKKLPDPI